MAQFETDAGGDPGIEHKIPIIVFNMISKSTPYQEFGGDYFDCLNPTRIAKRLIQRLEAIGYKVELSPATSGSNA